ncbi:NAD(P)/FAD-dependent oxidoreductase [Spirillospora sp. NPDC047279]|uniref:NAD(P)/FAD-dependent oxidoreductase n=1 Tax=Spirillospora sp. NPDC047279 TaxID=3155478 RepID=UPI0033F88C64
MESVEFAAIGGGPAGLTAAFELARRGRRCVVFEADSVVGGISQTVQRDGWRFDIGGHRFFTKVRRVEDFWNEILQDDDFLLRPRMSRIYYDKKFFDYPLRAQNALSNLGILEALRCLGSYAWARVRPPKDQTTFEGWVAARFGWRLYRIFFKTYTEKVWGVPASSIQADWAAQRIKNLSLGKAIWNALRPQRNQKEITSLIEEFRYPKFGPGMMWEACADQVRAAGSEVRLDTAVRSVSRTAGGRLRVVARDRDGAEQTVECGQLVSSMPLATLVRTLSPAAPPEVIAAAEGLAYRDFLTVALVVPERFSFPDNWIYIHSPEVRLGRVQNYGSWSPYLVKDGRTCLGLEYFVNEGDDLWAADDDDLIALGTRELDLLGLVTAGAVEAGHVVRMPKAYPVYDAHYAANVETLRKFLEVEWPEIHPVGRNGMHRYNNQDHSMLTAMLTVENLVDGANHDVWAVNVEADYHEEKSGEGRPGGGTGRDAPILPAPRSAADSAVPERSPLQAG